MPEKIMMRLNKDFEGGFWAVDPAEPDSNDYQPVQAIYEITPYGMMLASLASCTAQIVHAYAKNHEIALDEVEFKLAYHHSEEQSENKEQNNLQGDRITEQVQFHGDLTKQEMERLFQVAHHCPIERVLKDGIIIKSELE
ncbi:MAG: OsmC family protein [Anaerolineales bacterium]